MTTDKCPHCDETLPDFRDAFCPYCREPLDEPPEPVEVVMATTVEPKPPAVVIINCPHCSTRVMPSPDGMCPACRKTTRDVATVDATNEPVEVVMATVVEREPTAVPAGPRLLGKITVDVSHEFPNLCVLCGCEAALSARFRFQRHHAVKKSIFGIFTGFWGLFFAHEAFDDRPIDLSLPVCGEHAHDARLNEIKGTPVGNAKFARRVTLSGLHPDFIAAAKRHWKNQWDDLSQQINDLES